MLKVLLFGILAGLDNFQVSGAVGLSGVPRRKQWSIAAVFAFFEMTMPFVGLLIGNRLQSVLKEIAPWLGPIFMILVGIVVLIRSAKEKDQAELLQTGWVLFPMAFFMSLDNLMAGVGFGALGYSVPATASIMGVCSASMCFLGLLAGDRVRRWIPKNIEIVTGLYLISLAVYKIAVD